jgi:hypothetical protein
MAYTINLTDGQIFATVADGTINTASSMVLVGKNYAGYGEFLDENFIHLLENGANSTPPGAPLTGQLWWDKATNTMKVYTGTTFKTISSATAAATSPSNNVVGDLWFDTTNQQLKVWNGSAFVLIGPASTAGQGTSGAVIATVLDSVSVSHVVVQLFVENTIVAMVSKDPTFTPQTAILGFSTISPGIQLSSNVTNALFRGTALNAQALDSLTSSSFMRTNTNTSTTGTLGVLTDSGLTFGLDQDGRLSVDTATSAVIVTNQTTNSNILFRVSPGGVPTTAMTINGATGTISGNQINANYADVAERFAADQELLPGTVVELGGRHEITMSQQELSENVFGVISTRAAYLMNSNAGTDDTHPAVAVAGRTPVRCIGVVKKGDRLVSSGQGLARAAKPGEATPFNQIGRALTDKAQEDVGTVEAMVIIK